MAGIFDPYDKNSWYFGPMTRPEANSLLMAEGETGVFLLRDSSTSVGDLVLCVKEDNKVSHYIIQKVQQGETTRYRIGDQIFPDVPALLLFYMRHYLDTTNLMRPANKKWEKVRAKYDFDGSDSDDLPFRKGEILIILNKDEDQWWTAKNGLGQTGSIPVPYVVALNEDNNGQDVDGHHTNGSTPEPTTIAAQHPSQSTETLSPPTSKSESIKYTTPSITRKTPKLPAMARVKQRRVPSAYDKTALSLEVGDIVKVTKMNLNGQWEGELNGKVGSFPFTCVAIVEDHEENHKNGTNEEGQVA